VLELLTEHLAQWATSISFPELSHLPCVVLRGFIKGCAVERFRRQAKQLVDALERNATYVGNARDGVSFAPQDLAAAATFLSSDKERAQVRRGSLLVQHWEFPGKHYFLTVFHEQCIFLASEYYCVGDSCAAPVTGASFESSVPDDGGVAD
jgi:hypothetical protein